MALASITCCPCTCAIEPLTLTSSPTFGASCTCSMYHAGPRWTVTSFPSLVRTTIASPCPSRRMGLTCSTFVTFPVIVLAVAGLYIRP